MADRRCTHTTPSGRSLQTASCMHRVATFVIFGVVLQPRGSAPPCRRVALQLDSLRLRTAMCLYKHHSNPETGLYHAGKKRRGAIRSLSELISVDPPAGTELPGRGCRELPW